MPCHRCHAFVPRISAAWGDVLAVERRLVGDGTVVASGADMPPAVDMPPAGEGMPPAGEDLPPVDEDMALEWAHNTRAGLER